jgi:hypothetical protein
MSDWDPWVDFVHGSASSKYNEKGSADSPATWYISIGDINEGDTWAQSAGFPVLPAVAVKGMSKAVAGTCTAVFGAPPPGYTFTRVIPCDNCEILTGKSKTVPGRLILVGRTTTTVAVALIDIVNTNKGAEGVALDAFGFAVDQAVASGI